MDFEEFRVWFAGLLASDRKLSDWKASVSDFYNSSSKVAGGAGASTQREARSASLMIIAQSAIRRREQVSVACKQKRLTVYQLGQPR